MAAVSPGILLVDKPGGMTSHDVVARARRALGTRKIGHAGTLDPMATGLLVLGVEGATRLLTFIVGLDKTYEATIRLGVATDSDDADGQTTATTDAVGPRRRTEIRRRHRASHGRDLAGAQPRVGDQGRRASGPTTSPAQGVEVELTARAGDRQPRFDVLAERREGDGRRSRRRRRLLERHLHPRARA